MALCEVMRTDSIATTPFVQAITAPETTPSHVHYVVNALGYKRRMLDFQFDDDPVIAARRKEGIPDDDGVAGVDGRPARQA